MRVETDRPASVWDRLWTYAGPVAIVIGLALEFLGWYGVSGENVEAKQLPYLASATIPGAALIVAGALVTARDRRLGRLYDLLTTPESEAPDPGPAPDPRAETGKHDQATDRRDAAPSVPAPRNAPPYPGTHLSIPDGTTYHRPTCALVVHKAEAYETSDDEIAERGLRPCPVCAP